MGRWDAITVSVPYTWMVFTTIFTVAQGGCWTTAGGAGSFSEECYHTYIGKLRGLQYNAGGGGQSDI